ncbi:hypothetical protein CDAR_51841 [Caerostris darwini]|uniref:Uncharacterized protein n=1 Tax=Caerostris darwini TaxID=1538125 RepID=A0AAV4RW80_9ARAC|nr:hypothetical protein CDAR_51841 [Caerostris darwini]
MILHDSGGMIQGSAKPEDNSPLIFKIQQQANAYPIRPVRRSFSRRPIFGARVPWQAAPCALRPFPRSSPWTTMGGSACDFLFQG